MINNDDGDIQRNVTQKVQVLHLHIIYSGFVSACSFFQFLRYADKRYLRIGESCWGSMASSVFADKSRAVKSFRAARRCITLHTYIHPSYIYREQYSIQHVRTHITFPWPTTELCISLSIGRWVGPIDSVIFPQKGPFAALRPTQDPRSDPRNFLTIR